MKINKWAIALSLIVLSGGAARAAPSFTNQWVYIKNFAAVKSGESHVYLRVDGVDSGAVLSGLSDEKSQWMLIDSGDGRFRIYNRWARNNEKGQAWLWIDRNEGGEGVNSVQLGAASGSLAKWDVSEVVSGDAPAMEIYHIETKNRTVINASGEPEGKMRASESGDIQMGVSDEDRARWIVEPVDPPASLGLIS